MSLLNDLSEAPGAATLMDLRPQAGHIFMEGMCPSCTSPMEPVERYYGYCGCCRRTWYPYLCLATTEYRLSAFPHTLWRRGDMDVIGVGEEGYVCLHEQGLVG